MATILLIEDNDAFRDLVAAGLVKAGHLVLTATNGNEAFALLATEHPHLIVTDLVMPERDGVEVIAKLRAANTDVIPIIAISGSSPHSRLYLKIAASLGATRVLSKPFPIETLVKLIEEMLGASAGTSF